jgi:hypothetical protein
VFQNAEFKLMFIKTQSILKKHNCSMLLIVKNAMHSLCIYKMQSVHIAEFVNGGGGLTLGQDCTVENV